MTKAELSPNSQASCQGCQKKIHAGSIRIGVSAKYDGMETQASSAAACFHGGANNNYLVAKKYYHAQCYRESEDFMDSEGLGGLMTVDQVREYCSGYSSNETTSCGGIGDGSVIATGPGAVSAFGQKRGMYDSPEEHGQPCMKRPKYP